MSDLRTVWGIGTPRTLRPQWALLELALDYEHKKITPRSPGMDDPAFKALSKRHKVPSIACKWARARLSSSISLNATGSVDWYCLRWARQSGHAL